MTKDGQTKILYMSHWFGSNQNIQTNRLAGRMCVAHPEKWHPPPSAVNIFSEAMRAPEPPNDWCFGWEPHGDLRIANRIHGYILTLRSAVKYRNVWQYTGCFSILFSSLYHLDEFRDTSWGNAAVRFNTNDVQRKQGWLDSTCDFHPGTSDKNLSKQQFLETWCPQLCSDYADSAKRPKKFKKPVVMDRSA